MTDSSLDFDAIAADDGLIEAIRSGATTEDVDSDPAAATLVALRDAADQPEPPAEPVATPARTARARRVPHRRIVATGLASCMLVTGGIGTAVAGDPTAAFRYLFHQGVEFGSRIGTPDDQVNADPGAVGGASDHATMNTAPRQQGSAAAPRSGERGIGGRFGFERDARDGAMSTRKNLGPGSGSDQSFADESDDPDVLGDSGFEDFDSAPGTLWDDETGDPSPTPPTLPETTEPTSPETDDTSDPDHDETNVGPTSDPTEEPSEESDDESTEDPSDEPDDEPSTLLPTPPPSDPPPSDPPPSDPPSPTPTDPETPTDPTPTSPNPPDPTSDPDTPTAPGPTASTSPAPTDPASATSSPPTSEPAATPSDTDTTG